MNIGIIGSGLVGQALATGFIAHGHGVLMGSRERNNERAHAWAARVGARASTGTFADAATFAEVAVVATAAAGTENALRLAGATNLAGKVVIDATNALDFSKSVPTLMLGHTDSWSEQVQRWIPDARVVKAFNPVGAEHMVNPTFPGGPPTMFFCGNDAAAKRTVRDIIAAFGWEPLDAGTLDRARYIEPMGMLWVLLAIQGKSRNHAYRLLTK